jgi:signal transduction histidine kinase
VLVVAALQVIALAAYPWSRRSGGVPGTVDLLGWLWLLSLPAVALSFAAGFANRRLHLSAALQRLTLSLRAPATPGELRRRLADTLEDPSVRIVYRLTGDHGRWVDESGWPAAPPEGDEGAAVTRVELGGRRTAAVVYDPVLAPDAALVRAAATYGLVVLENTRLINELRASLERLSEEELRSAAAARTERKRIERDLHDGAQQRLVSLRIHLALLGERLNGDAPARAAELARLAEQVELTIEDVRSLAHRVYPEPLARRGVVAALRAIAEETAVPTAVVSDGVGRLAPDIETTVYFACAEAVQNAVKHATGASRITITLSTAGDELRFAVHDDGPGLPDGTLPAGAGIENMRDRLGAVGGRLEISSEGGRGTTVVGLLPIAEVSRAGL